MTNKRIRLLESVVALGSDFRSSVEQLGLLSWDSPQLIMLQRSQVASVLERFLAGQVSAEQVEEWANAIECRDDIGFSPGEGDLLHGVIFELANPLLTRPLSESVAAEILSRLS